MSSEPRRLAEALVTNIREAISQWDTLGRWSIVFPDKGSAFEVQGEGVRLIIDIGPGVEKSGLSRLIAQLTGAPVQVRLRAWYLNEFVERIMDSEQEAKTVLLSILEAHKPTVRKMPKVSGAPEYDDPDRPSIGADD